MEADVVEAIQRRLQLFVCTNAIGGTIGMLAMELSLSLIVSAVALVNGFGIALDGVVAVDDRVLGGQVGLVEVIRMGDVSASKTRLKSKRSIRPNEHGYTACATSRTRVAFLVESNIAGNHNGITAVPRRGFYPVDRVEESVCAAVTSIHSINTFNVCISSLLEQLHEHRLNRLRFVENSLGADFESADGLDVNCILLDQRGEGCQGQRVDIYDLLIRVKSWPAVHGRVRTFAVIAEAHFCLTEADSVFSFTDAVELLELGLIDALDMVSCELQ